MNAGIKVLLVAACVPLTLRPQLGGNAPICLSAFAQDDEEYEPVLVGGGDVLSLDNVADGGNGTIAVFRSNSPQSRAVRQVLELPFNQKGNGDSDLHYEWSDSQLTLSELAEAISRIHGINVICDLSQLEPDKVTIQVPWLAANHNPAIGPMLSNLLRYRVSTIEPLGFMIDEAGLVISYLDRVEELGLEFAVYDTRSLPEMDEYDLMDVVEQSSGAAWQHEDGEGGTVSIRSGNRVLVRHTYDVQRRVHRALNALATARSRAESDN